MVVAVGSFIKYCFLNEGNTPELTHPYLVELLNDVSLILINITKGVGLSLFKYETSKNIYFELISSDPLQEDHKTLLDLVFTTFMRDYKADRTLAGIAEVETMEWNFRGHDDSIDAAVLIYSEPDRVFFRI